MSLKGNFDCRDIMVVWNDVTRGILDYPKELIESINNKSLTYQEYFLSVGLERRNPEASIAYALLSYKLLTKEEREIIKKELEENNRLIMGSLYRITYNGMTKHFFKCVNVISFEDLKFMFLVVEHLIKINSDGFVSKSLRRFVIDTHKCFEKTDKFEEFMDFLEGRYGSKPKKWIMEEKLKAKGK